MKAYGRQIAVMLIGLAALAAPAAANASVTIGSNLAPTPAPTGVSCSNPGSVPCTTSSIAIPPARTAPGGLLAPSDGVVVRWRIKVGDAVTPVAFRVTRPGNSSTRTGAGTSSTVTPAADSISTYEVQIPIQTGDAVGIDFNAAATLDATTGAADATLGIWNPRLQDGAAPRPAGSQFPGEVLVNADIEPDCDSDGLGDETQDPSLLGGNCPVRGRALTLDANKNKVKKGKKVRLSGRVTELVGQGECESGQTVELQRKKPSKTTFTTVEQLQTDAAGSFSTKKNVKKTFQYRAQIAESGGCAGQLSNTEKVKVKKKIGR